MTRSFPAVVLAVLVGLGFGYAAYGTVTVLSNVAAAYRLWPLELAVAGLAAWLVLRLFERVLSGQDAAPRLDRGMRAVQRLAYRRGPGLALEQITAETLLDETAALAALRAMEEAGAARREADGRWRVLGGEARRGG